MAVDREATLKKADQLLKQGKLAGAIDEYVRLIEDRPSDWNAVNVLGDLYAKAGDTKRAAEQFIHAADHLYGLGFFPRASALYKKALKVRRDDDHAIWQLADIAGHQGLSLEARSYYARLIQDRGAAGNEPGVVDCVIRLAQLGDADIEAKMAGASALINRGEPAPAAKLIRGAADILTKEGRLEEAVDKLRHAARLAPYDQEIAERLAEAEAALPPPPVEPIAGEPEPTLEAEAAPSIEPEPSFEPEATPSIEPEPFDLAPVSEVVESYAITAEAVDPIESPGPAMVLEGFDMDPAAVLAEIAAASEPEAVAPPAPEIVIMPEPVVEPVAAAPEPAEPLPLEAIFEALRDQVTREQEEKERQR